MNLIHITNLLSTRGLDSIPVYTIQEESLPKIRKALKRFDFSEYDKVIFTGSKVIQVALELAGMYKKGERFNIHNHHGYWFRIGSTWCMTSYGKPDIVEKGYQEKDIEKFYTEPYVPEIDTTVIPHIHSELTNTIVLDIETTGLDYRNDTITSIQVYYPTLNTVSYIDTDISYYIAKLYEYVAASGCTVIGHNLMFDLCFLSEACGKSFFDFDIVDTMLLSKARGQHHNSLKHLATMYSTYHPNAYSTGTYNKEYAIVDNLATYDIYKHFTRKPLRPIDTLSMRSLQVFGNAKIKGIHVDLSILDSVYSDIQHEVQALEKTLTEYAGIEWSNNNQVSKALIDNGVKLRSKTATGNYSVSVQALEPLREQYSIVDTLLQYRKLTKLLSTFYSTYKDTLTIEHPYLHPEVKVLGADTGRTSCVNPNIQQVPKGVKRIFPSRFNGGSIGQFDLAQSELRCAVWLSGDTTFAKALQQDAHRVTASKAFGIPVEEVTDVQRKAAKAVNFAALYGATSASNLAERTGASEKAIQACFDALQTAYPKLIRWQQEQVATAKKYLRGMDNYKKVRDFRYSLLYGGKGKVRRDAMNTPVQAMSAYVCLELCCYIADKLTAHNSFVMMQIHDSVFIDVHPDEVDIVTQICKDAFQHLNTIEPIASLPGWGLIPCGGELTYNQSMYDDSEDVIVLSSERNTQ
jgi:DNA polymerase-1